MKRTKPSIWLEFHNKEENLCLEARKDSIRISQLVGEVNSNGVTSNKDVVITENYSIEQVFQLAKLLKCYQVFNEQIEIIESYCMRELQQVESKDDLEYVVAKYTGKNSLMSFLLSKLAHLPPKERKLVGEQANQTLKLIKEKIASSSFHFTDNE